jgi:hypothetical protein
MAACTVPFFGGSERQILPPGRKGSAAAPPPHLDYENKPLIYLDIFSKSGWPGPC